MIDAPSMNYGHQSIEKSAPSWDNLPSIFQQYLCPVIFIEIYMVSSYRNYDIPTVPLPFCKQRARHMNFFLYFIKFKFVFIFSFYYYLTISFYLHFHGSVGLITSHHFINIVAVCLCLCMLSKVRKQCNTILTNIYLK